MFDSINPLFIYGSGLTALIISNLSVYLYIKNKYKIARRLHGDKLSGAEQERIRDLISRGHTIHYISKVTGRGHSAISRVRQDYFAEKQSRSPQLPNPVKKEEIVNPIVLNSKNTPLIEQEKKKIVDMFIMGQPVEDMVNATGRSKSTLYRIKDEYNALVARNKPKDQNSSKTRPYKKVGPELITKIHRLVDEGLTYSEIARITKRASSTIFYIVADYKNQKNK